MSFFSGTIHSKALHMDTSLGVILPQDSRKHRGVESLVNGIEPREKPGILVLLHGLSDNWAAWAHRTAIQRYAEAYDIAVLMPEGQRGFYCDMQYGPAYFEYLTQELPELAAHLFNISTAPRDTMIAGLSMGGYGALLCGLTYPDRYACTGAFSSVCDMPKFIKEATEEDEPGWHKDRTAIFGASLECPENKDLFNLASERADVYMTCGLNDSLLEENRRLALHLQKLGARARYEEWNGNHEWEFWDESIQRMLKYALLEKR